MMPLPSCASAQSRMNRLRAAGLSLTASKRMLGRSKPVPTRTGRSSPRFPAISGTCPRVAVAVNAATTGRAGSDAMNEPMRR